LTSRKNRQTLDRQTLDRQTLDRQTLDTASLDKRNLGHYKPWIGLTLDRTNPGQNRKGAHSAMYIEIL
jgi:hypothetical protein